MAQDPLNKHVAIIGAGQAGFEVCAQLRSLGMTGPISVIGAENQRPYQRPPLSKAYLLGKMGLDRLFFRPAQFFEDENIDLHLATSCIAIDRAAKQIRLSDATTLGYDALVLTTGARPVRLPDAIGGALKGVHYMRDLGDADRMAEDVKPGRKVLVIGGGYIGLEAAAVCAGLGLQVVVVEAAERILQRVASVQTSNYFRQMHRDHGVDIRENVMLETLMGDDGHVTRARLSDGSTLDVDLAIVGIGIRPNQELAADAGLEVDNGVKVDAQCRTSDPDIFAAGDCVSFPHKGGRIRLESVGNAIDQGQLVARIIAGQDISYQPRPWFWSDQYDTKLQIAGLSTGYDRIVTRQSSDSSVSFWYFKGDQLLAVDAMNDPRAYMVAKRLIDAGKSPHADKVADLDNDLKHLLATC